MPSPDRGPEGSPVEKTPRAPGYLPSDLSMFTPLTTSRQVPVRSGPEGENNESTQYDQSFEFCTGRHAASDDSELDSPATSTTPRKGGQVGSLPEILRQTTNNTSPANDEPPSWAQALLFKINEIEHQVQEQKSQFLDVVGVNQINSNLDGDKDPHIKEGHTEEVYDALRRYNQQNNEGKAPGVSQARTVEAHLGLDPDRHRKRAHLEHRRQEGNNLNNPSFSEFGSSVEGAPSMYIRPSDNQQEIERTESGPHQTDDMHEEQYLSTYVDPGSVSGKQISYFNEIVRGVSPIVKLTESN